MELADEGCSVIFADSFGHEDYMMWLDVLKEGGIAKSSQTIEACYRETSQSVSSYKMKALSWRWHILRHEVKLSAMNSIYHLGTSLFFIWLKKSRFSYALPRFIKA